MTTQLRQMHLTENDFKQWEQGMLSPVQMERFLTHTANCPHCGDAWMAYMEHHSEALAQPPLYSLKVGVALAASIYMVFAMDAQTLNQMMQLFGT